MKTGKFIKTFRLALTLLFFCCIMLFVGRGVARTAAEEPTPEKYTAVTDEGGALIGFDSSDTVAGALYMGIRPDAALSQENFLYAVTEFQLGTDTVFDYETGGLIIHLSTLGNTALLRTRIYVFANGYDGNLFFARGGNEGSKTYPVLSGGVTVGEFKGVKSGNICTVDPGISGVVTIPWKDMTQSGSDASGWASDLFSRYQDWRVAILTDVTSAGGIAGEGIGVASIASYAVQNGEYTVVEGFSAENAGYSYETDGQADVDFSDIAAGSLVATAKKWATAVSVRNYVKDTDRQTVDMLEYGRVVRVEYVTADGEILRSAEYLNIRNISRDAQGNYGYEFQNMSGAPAIPGAEFVSVENDFENMIVRFVYEKVLQPQIFVSYVDPAGRELAESTSVLSEYDEEREVYFWSVTPERSIGEYNFVQADGELSGEILRGEVTEENSVIKIKLLYAYKFGEYDEHFTQVNETDGSFVGIKLDKSTEGALYFGTREGATLLDGFNNAVIEFRLSDTIHDKENGGLLIQYSTVGYADYNANVIVFVKGTDNRFYSVVSGVPSSRTDTLIYADGTVGSISVRKSDSRYSAMIPGNTSGTWNIRWSDILDNTHGELSGLDNPEFRVVVWTDVCHATAYENVGNGISIGVIATYQRAGDFCTVVEGISTSELTYSYDPEDEAAEVNVADITKGTRVYNTHCWGTAISVANYLEDTERKTIDLIEYSRISTAQILVRYVNENGASIGTSGFAKVMYDQNGMKYSVAVPEFMGYVFKSSDKELTGVIAEGTDLSQMSFVLTYERIKYTITFVYLDTEGKEIAESSTQQAEYGEYCEFEAPDIQGYTFVASSRSLHLTVMNNYTIQLTYEKSSGGGCGGGCSGNVAWAFLPAAMGIFLIVRKRH